MASRKEVRNFVARMKYDPHLGCRIGADTYKVTGTTGRYYIIHKESKDGDLMRTEVFTEYVTDFVQRIYDGGQNAKAVRV